MSNPNREVLKYRGKYTPELYNQFFNPNICHVCKSIDRDNLILCDQCCLISYCSKEHKTIHYIEHMEICTIIAEVLKVKSQRDTCGYSDWQQWIQSRKEFMKLIQQKIDRPMEPYMQQMILWSKSCIVCFKQTELRVCKRCFSANYCDEHAEVFHKKHYNGKCDRLMLALNIDIQTISGKITNISYEFFKLVNYCSHFEEMLEFCMKFMLMQRRDLDWITKDFVQSDYLSDPLTIYSGLDRLSWLIILQQYHVIIHIIAANPMKREGLLAWEILLHLVPELQHLTIIMIGSELVYNSDSPKLCFSCMCKKKELTILSFPMLYHDYLDSSAKFKIPTIIIGFQVELNKSDTWLKPLEAIESQCTPLFLTCVSEKIARNNIIIIQEVLDKIVEPIFSKRNHFSGLTPHKDLETGDTYFRNEHLIIYSDLLLYDTDQSITSSEE
ncbi:uncharacterized protein LOC116846784 [Odontomachus brunneus]|uniref:uncharacterized protein LOC116846784 n=1 Tax=Odontomachus brunneus TaxID=486640 RepID=UPI0013F26CCD|nr:uncharacterized protein LOC116846784 [Odontomachus brunneus]